MNTEIKQELTEIATSLVSIGNENCYRVPDHYFEALADEVVSKIQLPFTQLPFTAPTPAYFDGLADSIMSKIKSNGIIVEEDSDVTKELMEISPLVASIKKVNVYTAPAYYFTNFKVAVPATEEKSKVVPLRRPVRWMRYAAAAAVIGLIAISGILLFKNDRTGNYQYSVATNISKILPTISKQEIANYINNSPADIGLMPSAYDDDSKLNAGSLAEQLLNDVSDADIQEYLKENTQPGEKDIKGI